MKDKIKDISEEVGPKDKNTETHIYYFKFDHQSKRFNILLKKVFFKKIEQELQRKENLWKKKYKKYFPVLKNTLFLTQWPEQNNNNNKTKTHHYFILKQGE